MKSLFLDFIHLCIFFIILTIPIHPKKVLSYTVYIPLLLYLIWIVCDGCPLTNINKTVKNEPLFIHKILLNFFPNITNQRVESMINLYLIATVYIAHYRLYAQKKNYIESKKEKIYS